MIVEQLKRIELTRSIPETDMPQKDMPEKREKSWAEKFESWKRQSWKARSHLDKCKSVDGCGYEKHCHVFCVLDRKLESKLHELISTTSELCLNYIWTLSELSLNYIWTKSELSLNTIWVKFELHLPLYLNNIWTDPNLSRFLFKIEISMFD